MTLLVSATMAEKGHARSIVRTEEVSIMHRRASKRPAWLDSAVRVRSKVWLEVDGRFAVGEGAIALLEAVTARGSLRQAAVAIGWSYRHAWDYVRQIEAALGVRVIETSPTKPRAGAALTDGGLALLDGLRVLQQAIRTECDRVFRAHLRPKRTTTGRQTARRRGGSSA